MYVKDVAHPASSGANVSEIKSVEVLQGPQSALLDHNAIGGALVMKTAGPVFTGVTLTAGAGGRIRGAAALICNVLVAVGPASEKCLGWRGYDEANTNDLSYLDYKISPDASVYSPYSTSFPAEAQATYFKNLRDRIPSYHDH